MAKANRVIQKPKPPVIKHVAIVDPNTGVISGYASGTNIVLGDVESQRNWRDVTDVPGGKFLTGGNLNRKFIKDGKVINKPRVRLIIDARKIEIGRGRAKISYEVLEGEVEELSLDIKSNGSNSKDKIKKNQHIEIGGSSRRRVTVRIDDPLIFAEEPVLVIDIVPPEELIVPPRVTSSQVVDDLVLEKKEKKDRS